MTDSFSAKFLYDQDGTVEDGVSIYTAVYAVLWTYPGATSQTSTRIRASCMYTKENNNYLVYSGLMEQWSQDGWRLIEEYYDERYEIDTPKKLCDRLLNHAHSFLMGIPLEDIDADFSEYQKETNDINLDEQNTKKLNVIDFSANKNKTKE